MNRPGTRMHLYERSTLLEFDDIPPVTLLVGVRGLAEDVLLHDPPSPVELERAIDVVEEALTKSRLAKADRGALMIADALLKEFPGLSGTSPGLALDAVEALFGGEECADESEGAGDDPGGLGLPVQLGYARFVGCADLHRRPPRQT